MKRAACTLLLLGWSASMPAPPAPPQRVVVRLPPGADARAFSLREVAPGVGAGFVTGPQLTALRRAHPAAVVEPSLRLRPSLDRARDTIEVDGLWADSGLSGAGAVVGVIDRGFDVSHPAFLDENGESRVAWLMTDEAPAGLHPDLEEAFGCNGPVPCAIYAKADLDASIAAGTLPPDLRDLDGHGTLVTSLAAGNGDLSTTDRTYAGVAPEASLVLVMQSSAAYVDQVLNGARFIFDRAEEMGMPAVINLSSGYHGGPHDGSSALASGLAAFVADAPPGRAIVVAAGNDGALLDDPAGDLGIHTSVELAADVTCPVPMLTIDDGPVDIWLRHDAQHPLSVSLQGPGGETWLEMTDRDTTVEVGSVAVSLDVDRPGATDDLRHVWLRLEGTWPWGEEATLSLRGQGPVDAWAHSVLDYTVAHMLFRAPTRSRTVDIPAVHPRLIAVGATVNRMDWPSPFGSPVTEPYQPGELPDYSAWGPGPGGAFKPDLVAPGHHVVGALAGAADPRDSPGSSFYRAERCQPPFSACALVDENHGVLSGTSMAAPLVAGVAALMLQEQPTLTQPQLRSLLVSGAAPTGRGPPEARGVGVVQARVSRGLSAAPPADEPPDAGASRWHLSASRLRRGEATRGIVHLRRADGAPVRADPARLSLEGEGFRAEAVAAVGPASLGFAVRPEADAVTLRLSYDGIDLGDEQLAVGEPAGLCGVAPAPIEEDGGCAVRPGGSPTNGWAWPLLVAMLARWSRLRARGRWRRRRPA